MKIRVYIATTEGAVEILRLTEEDPQVKSVVCLNGKAMPLPITRGYHSFVQDPTGVIQRTFHHSAYRLDVSAPVDDGYSWQLPVFAAHALFADDALARSGEKPERAIWLTGEVDRDLKVHGIDKLKDKCERSRRLFDELAQHDIPITIILPEDNADDVPDWVKTRSAKAQRLRLETINSAYQLTGILGLNALAAAEKSARAAASGKKKTVRHKGGKGRKGGNGPPAWAAWSAAAVVLLAVLGIGAVQAGVVEWTRMHNAGEEKALQASLRSAVDGDCTTCSLYARAFMTLAGVDLPPPPGTVPADKSVAEGKGGDVSTAEKKTTETAKEQPEKPTKPEMARQPAELKENAKAGTAPNSGRSSGSEKAESKAKSDAGQPAGQIAVKPKAAPPPPKPKPQPPAKPVLSVEIHERRAPNPLRCEDVRDGQVDAVERRVLKISKRRFAASPMLDLCEIKLAVRNTGKPAYMWAFAIAVPERRLLVGDRRDLYDAEKQRPGEAVWDIRVPPRAERALNYHFVALASDEPMGDMVAPLVRNLMRRGQADYVDDWRRAERQLQEAGIVVTDAWHELRPGLAGLPEDRPIFNNAN